MKTKINQIVPIVILPAILSLGLNSCTSPAQKPPAGMETQYIGQASTPVRSAYSRQPTTSNASRSSETIDNGIRGAVSGEILGTDATMFANKVKTMEIGKTTKSSVLSSIGTPENKSVLSDCELWTYLLNTGGFPSSSFMGFNNSGILVWIKVIKTEMNGASLSNRVVYEKGKDPIRNR